jgi:hypothetical protein
MNKELLLKWLISDAEKQAPRYVGYRREADLKKCLYELNNRRRIELPSPLPKDPEAMLRVLEQHFDRRVSFVSLVLNHHFPDRFLFYRVSELDQEILEGLAFFSEVVPEFKFPFASVGTKALDRYLQLNDQLQAFARTAWPKPKRRQAAVLAFLYEGLGMLFLEKSSYNRYWLMVARPEYFDILDKHREINWSGCKEMKPGDLVFMYRTSPRKAITNLYRVKEAPEFDPWGGWRGFWVTLAGVGSIPDISFADMRSDPVFNLWGPVRRHFQWTVVQAVPHSVYNRLLDRIPDSIREEHRLTPEPVADVRSFGQFALEAEFEEQIVKPLIRRWGFKFDAQYPCLFRLGSQDTHARVDCHVSDARGPFTLFEDKLRIANDRELEPAVAQAKSYALMLGLSSFVVAAPEGLWVYSLARNVETLRQHVSADELPAQEENVRRLLLSLRT